LRVEPADPGRGVDRRGLARAWIESDPKRAYARRKRRPAFSNEGEEVVLGDESVVNPDVPAIVVAETFVVRRKNRVVRLASCAVPTSLGELARADLGAIEITASRVVDKQLVAHLRRTFAGHTLDSWEEVPEGARARAALLKALVEGRVMADAVERAREEMATWDLYRRLERIDADPTPDLEAWLDRRLEAIGIESGADLALLLPDDLRFEWPIEVDEHERLRLVRSYPATLDFSEARYQVDYDVFKRTATLVLTSGSKRFRPPPSYLPSWPGWTVRLKRGNALTVLRDR
jgi:hypothetical protein